MAEQQKTIQELIKLLESHPSLKTALQDAITTSDQPGISSLSGFYDYLEKMLTHIPTEDKLMHSVREFYYIVARAPGDILRKNSDFNNWVNQFVVSRGDFLDTVESVATLDTFINCPDYKIDDYIKPRGGWKTYNEFLARELKAGKRPIAEPCNNHVIASPADSTYMGDWQIDEDSMITVKGTTYNVSGLLADSKYKNKFTGGIFCHSFLAISDYHRFHMPVAGVVKEVKKVTATTWVNEEKKPDGKLENIDDVGFQFEHTRAFIIVESDIGLIAIIPVGMGHISSVTINAEEGVTLAKGEEFGYFAFGGSDIVMLFENRKIKFNAKKEKHYKYGEKIAELPGD